MPAALPGLASLLLLLCALLGLGVGVLLALRVRVTGVDSIYAVAAGWGALVTVSIVGAYLGLSLRHVLYGGLVVGCGVLFAVIRQDQHTAMLARAGVGLLSVLPAVAAAASFSSLQYDEFSHWLSNAFYLYANDTLPTAALPNLQTGKQAYPIGIPFISFAVSAIEGGWDERAPKLLPLVLAGPLGVLMAGIWLRTDRPGIAAIAVAALVMTLLNPFFDPRVAVTTYSDVPTAFLLAAMAYAVWRAGEECETARAWTVRAALVAVALVHVRETNMVLVAAAALSLPLAAATVRVGDGPDLRRSCAHALVFLAAPLAAFLIWRLHMYAQGLKPDMVARPLSAWTWSAPGTVLASLVGARLANNPLMGAGAVLVTFGLMIAGVVGWRRRAAATKRLTVGVATLVAAQAVLLAFSYIAVFSDDEVGRAASTWRYASHLGPLLMLAGAHALSCWRPALGESLLASKVGQPYRSPPIILAAVVALQLLCAGRWRIDCVYPHVRPGYEALVSLLAKVPPEASVAIVNRADVQLFGEAARLARTVAAADWRAPPALVVESHDAAPRAAYVIDLVEADPVRFSNGETTLRATMQPPRGDPANGDPPAITVTVATTCIAQ
jgi:hypothetical protein